MPRHCELEYTVSTWRKEQETNLTYTAVVRIIVPTWETSPKDVTATLRRTRSTDPPWFNTCNLHLRQIIIFSWINHYLGPVNGSWPRRIFAFLYEHHIFLFYELIVAKIWLFCGDFANKRRSRQSELAMNNYQFLGIICNVNFSNQE